jgi:large subunit ribosomal protein L21
LEGVVVRGKVLEHGKGKKVVVFKYKPKKNIRKKRGHRQPFTTVEILSIG